MELRRAEVGEMRSEAGKPRFLAPSLLAAALLAAVALAPSGAEAGSGGTTVPPPPPPHGSRAKIVDGLAVAPNDAPGRVVKAIDAANRIAKGHPYCWGGGHQAWKSNCYDCSGAVSYALHGAGLLETPMASGDLMSWGRPGRGAWISVYANEHHTFMTIAGLRFDTADTLGGGPGWAKDMGTYEKPKAFSVRQPGA
jgi:hypothetical protein